jgi:hypothetical protein
MGGRDTDDSGAVGATEEDVCTGLVAEKLVEGETAAGISPPLHPTAKAASMETTTPNPRRRGCRLIHAWRMTEKHSLSLVAATSVTEALPGSHGAVIRLIHPWVIVQGKGW